MTSNALENSSIEGAASVTTLDAVAEKYSKLVEVRNGFIEDYNGAVRGGSSVWATPEPLEALVDPINDELYNLGWMMAETPAKTEEMVKRAEGGKPVPQVFIDDIHYGGCDDIHAMDAKGDLDKVLSAA